MTSAVDVMAGMDLGGTGNSGLVAASSGRESATEVEADSERRFGGLRRLYGDAGYAHLRAASVAVVGLGGVGSWAVEALARSGVRRLVLIDFDHVAESNINRQVQALGSTLGMAKGEALRRRIADIHPHCDVRVVDEFASATNWPALLPVAVDALIDACDQGQAKLALARWALAERVALLCCGAAGGKQRADQIELADLADVTHDPLLATLRQRLRKLGAPRTGRMGVSCVFSRESMVAVKAEACAVGLLGSAAEVSVGITQNIGNTGDTGNDGSLNCHGHGSSVAVTAAAGFIAAGEVMRRLACGPTSA